MQAQQAKGDVSEMIFPLDLGLEFAQVDEMVLTHQDGAVSLDICGDI